MNSKIEQTMAMHIFAGMHNSRLTLKMVLYKDNTW